MSAWVMSVECSFHLDNNTVFTRLGLHTRSHGVLSFDSLFCSLRFSFFSPFPSCQLEGAPCLPQSNLSTSPWWTVTCPPSASSAFLVPHVCMYACVRVCARVRARACVCVLSLHSCRVLAHAACWGLSFQARAAVRLDAAGGRGRALPMERLHHCHRVLFNQARWLRL